MKKITILLFAISTVILFSCDFLDPEADNTREEEILDESAYICGPLNAVYNSLPTLFDVSMDAMTDNAVIRNYSGSYYRAAVGALSPNLNPLDCWTSCYSNIRLLNIFLSKMVLNDSTSYRTPVRFFALTNEQAYKDNLNMFYRLRGEAFALRAYMQLCLLQNFAGEGTNGEMLGIPQVGDKILDQSQDLMIPRASFDDCIQAIVDDCDSAVISCRLPDLYTGTSDVVYNQTISPHMSGAAAKGIKAKALLMAASPAFNKNGDAKKWEEAAKAAADLVKAVGGINTAFFTRTEYYFSKINNTSMTQNNVIMKGKWVTGNMALEASNYPAMMYGSATINVSQNLVDAFPDKKGYPISESSVYDPENPYANRDPRLALFVGYNGGKVGKHIIDISEAGEEYYNPLKCTSRSGYYLKKTLRDDQVVCGPSNEVQGTPRACIIIGLPDVYLMYAEAANEAWGVDGDPEGYGFTAKQALNRILTRDGASGNQYLNTVIGTDQDKFREYVRLQRRLELCFEGHYYYDLRRWYSGDSDWQAKLNVPVYGVRMNGGKYSIVELENRKFNAPYPPIPYFEEFNAGLVQNKGWK